MSIENNNNNENSEQQTQNKSCRKKLLDLNPTYRLLVKKNDVSYYTIYFFILIIFLYILTFKSNLIIFNFTNFLIKIYSQRDNNIYIEKLLEKNLYIQTLSFYQQSYLVNLSVKNLIDFYNNQGLYEKSEKMYEKYFTIIKNYNNKRTSSFYDNTNENLAQIYSEMGDIKLKLGKYQEAENFYNKAIEFKTNKKNLVLEKKHQIKIYCNEWKELNKIAFLKIKEKNYIEAETYLAKASIKYQEYNNDLSWEIIYNLSILHKHKGNFELAKKHTEYLLIHLPYEIYPVPDEKEAKTKYILDIAKLNSFLKQNLADIYVRENKNEEAIKLLKEALLINNKLYRENSICILCNHFKLYELYQKENINIQKEKEYKIIYSFKDKVLGTKNLKDEMLIEKLNILCNEMEII